MSRAVVFHASYGCDTGCCGHVVELGDREVFVFDHPLSTGRDRGWPTLTDKDVRQFVQAQVTEAFGAEHVTDIDWDECRVVDD